jgi:NRPS condensation-like uncharacterized protein
MLRYATPLGTRFSVVATNEPDILDQPYMHHYRPDEPWSVLLEVGVEGRLDEERLAFAVEAAAARHPVTRAWLAQRSDPDTRHRWEIDDALERLLIEVVECVGDADLAHAREELLSFTPSLTSAPPFALLLAHHPGGDSVLLNLNHAAVDGLGALRLMGSILRAYAGVHDTCSALDPLEVSDISGGAGVIESDEASGYGFQLMRLESAAMLARRSGHATASDVLLAALGVAVRRWNERHGGDVNRIALMMPVNLRPGEWQTDAVGNLASYVTVHLGVGDQDDLDSAIPATAARTRRLKEDGVAGLIVHLHGDAGAGEPELSAAVPLAGNRVVDSAVLSNVGRLEGVPDLGGDAGAVRSVWFSPPGRMPLGASVGTATLGNELFVALRYRRALFDAGAAADFAALYREVLIS